MSRVIRIKIEAGTLSDAIRVYMFRANMSARKLARSIGENNTAVWRAIRRPSKAPAKVLYKIVKYLGIAWEEFDSLFGAEIEKQRSKGER